MSLKVELKPGERLIIGTALVRNGDQRTRFFIEGDAPILREKDILTPATADTPAKKIYLAIQLMYLQQDFITAAPSALPLIAEVNNRILSGDLYKALKTAKRLITYEQELISHATRGERIRESGAGHAIAQGA